MSLYLKHPKYECHKFKLAIEMQICFNTELKDSSILLIFVPSLSKSNENFSNPELIKQIEYILNTGYHVLTFNTSITTPRGNSRRRIFNQNLKHLKSIINNIKQNEIPTLNGNKHTSRIEKIGLIGYSEGAELCIALSHESKDDIIKGIFSISPAYLGPCRNVHHKYFHYSGTFDNRNILPIWDIALVNKAGVIVNRGNHEGFLEKKEDTELEVHEQAEILVDCLSLFFKSVFESESNLLSIVNYLNDKYEAVFPLYSHTDKKIIEGTICDEGQSLVNELWRGKIIDSEPYKGSGIDNPGEFLFSGKEFLEKTSEFKNFISQAKTHIAKLDIAYAQSINTRKKNASLLVEAINRLYTKVITETTDFLGPIQIASPLPIIEVIEESILRLTGLPRFNDEVWEILEYNLNRYASKQFLINLILELRKLVTFPWRNLAYGKIINWHSQNAKYIIPVPYNMESTKHSHLSIRLAINFEYRTEYDEAWANPLKIGCFFNHNEVAAGEITIRPFNLEPYSIADPKLFFDVKNYYFSKWVYSYGLKNYLTHYFILLPSNKRVDTIELHFQSPSGAIMLSEVAFTN